MREEKKSELEAISGGPIYLNRFIDENLDLTYLNNDLGKFGLVLSLAYFPEENRLGYALYKNKDK